MKKIYVLGDSISIHYGPYLKHYLSSFMGYSRKEGEQEALLNLDNPQGANGGDSTRVLEFLKAMEKSGGIDTDYLLVNCGLHDLRIITKTGEQNISVDNYAKNLSKIIEIAANIKTKLIWIQTTPLNADIHNTNPAVKEMGFQRYLADCISFNEKAHEIMTSASIPIIDLFTFTNNLGSDLYCDHVHFNVHIREKQAAFIAGWLNALSVE